MRQFRPVKVVLAPEGVKTIPPEIETTAQLTDVGWKETEIGECPERPEFIGQGTMAKRKQHSLRLRVASTIHGVQGNDLPWLVTKVSSSKATGDDEAHSTWCGAQVRVLMSRTPDAAHVIFVGDPKTTTDALIEALLKRSQFTEYMSCLMDRLIGEENGPMQLKPSVDLCQSVHRPTDIDIPPSSTGYVYLLVSSQDNLITCIGQTRNLKRRFRQHASGKGGSRYTNLKIYQPWTILAYIVGFEEDTQDNLRVQREAVEKTWQEEINIVEKRHRSQGESALNADERASIGTSIVSRFTCLHPNLRIVMHGRVSKS